MVRFSVPSACVGFLLALSALGFGTAACSSETPSRPEPTPTSSRTITGVVRDGGGNTIGSATVRVQTTEYMAITDDGGNFNLDVSGLGQGSFNLTAWAPGYFCVGPVEAEAGDSDVELVLHPHSAQDNPDYSWMPSQYHPDRSEGQGCAECHSAANSDFSLALPVDEWLDDAHSQTVVNPRFLTMYTGTDVRGNQSPPTRYAYNRDYGSFPLRPDPNQPYYGPGYKLDFTDTAGNCAACHAPAASVDNPYGVDPTAVSGVPAEGVPCDFCHKIWDVKLDAGTGLPYANMPGVLTYEFRRPPEDHQFFAGPYDDVAPGEDTYLPLQTESQFCAACHFGVFWDTLVYNSFGEWLESPYNDPEKGKTCQDCHMPPSGADHFVLPEKGGLKRNPQTIFSHRMPGARDKQLLQNAVSLDVDASLEGDELRVQVRITNDQTGHHVPTDSPLRHMILLVSAASAGGDELELLDGPKLPEWAGEGDPEEGYYAGLPGVAYAKVLEELWTEVSPSGAYWNPTRVLSDNRLPALSSDVSHYTFVAPQQGQATVEVRLLFRRAFIELVNLKGWESPDILMAQRTVVVDDK